MTTTPVRATAPAPSPRAQRDIALVDLLDRLLDTGVVLAGDLVISLAGVDLVEIKLRALVRSIRNEFDETQDVEDT